MRRVFYYSNGQILPKRPEPEIIDPNLESTLNISAIHTKIHDLAKDAMEINIVIPAHNSRSLTSTLKALTESKLVFEAFQVHLTLVFSACTEEYIRDIRQYTQNIDKKNLVISYLISKKPGKAVALNNFLETTNSKVIFQVVDDITFGPYSLALLIICSFQHKEFGAVCLQGTPIYPEGKFLLGKVQQILYEKFYYRQNDSLVGRMFSFHKEIIPGRFPTDLVSEDYWLEMQVMNQTKGLLIILGTSAKYKLPRTWRDFFKFTYRNFASYMQLSERFHEDFAKYFGPSNNSIKFMLGAKTPSDTLYSLLIKLPHGTVLDFFASTVYLILLLTIKYVYPSKYKLKPYRTGTFARELSTLD